MLLVASAATAQVTPHQWDMQGNVGIGIPMSDLADVTDPGLALGYGLTRWFSKWAGFHLGLAAEWLGGKEGLPNLNLWHYNAGIETDLIDPATSKVRLHANVGLGATTTSVENGDSATDFTVNLGPNLEYKFNPHWNGVLGTQLYIIMADQTEYTLPVYLGFRYAFSD
jgi:hypothetical protein